MKFNVDFKAIVMSSKTHTNLQWTIVSAIAMVFIGVGLNIFVMQTLGSFIVAAALLALYLEFCVVPHLNCGQVA
jgi:hypothetical protein